MTVTEMTVTCPGCGEPPLLSECPWCQVCLDAAELAESVGLERDYPW